MATADVGVECGCRAPPWLQLMLVWNVDAGHHHGYG